MTKRVRARGEDVRTFILANIENHPDDVVKMTAEHYGITRQAVNKHLLKLTSEGALVKSTIHPRNYELTPLVEWRHSYQITPELAEDVVWREDVIPILGVLPESVLDIWHYCFTEMFNNAIDHSGGTEITVHVSRNAAKTLILLNDNGVGIFRKIQNALNLLDERHAILELSKGKLTTDPDRHTGEGIFFSSRLVDQFDILSGGVYFGHQFGDKEDWIIERSNPQSGTSVIMELNSHTARRSKEIFDLYTATEDDYGFTKTVVPVKLAQYGNDKLVSRSQAKRLLSRVELFKTVIFDFAGVPTVGQAFADEIFRVFPQQHPEVKLIPIHADPEVQQMIDRAKSVTVDAIPQTT
jgi:hypothetical protein